METIADKFGIADKTLHILEPSEIDPNPPVQSRFRLSILPRYLTPGRRKNTRGRARKIESTVKKKGETIQWRERGCVSLQREALIFGRASGARENVPCIMHDTAMLNVRPNYPPLRVPSASQTARFRILSSEPRKC